MLFKKLTVVIGEQRYQLKLPYEQTKDLQWIRKQVATVVPEVQLMKVLHLGDEIHFLHPKNPFESDFDRTTHEIATQVEQKTEWNRTLVTTAVIGEDYAEEGGYRQLIGQEVHILESFDILECAIVRTEEREYVVRADDLKNKEAKVYY